MGNKFLDRYPVLRNPKVGDRVIMKYAVGKSYKEGDRGIIVGVLRDTFYQTKLVWYQIKFDPPRGSNNYDYTAFAYQFRVIEFAHEKQVS